MRVLFIVPYVPNLVRVRPYQLIRNLVADGHQVILGTLWSEEQELKDLEVLRKICERVLAFQLKRARSLTNCLLALPTSKPLQYVYSWVPSLENTLEAFILDNVKTIDAIHVEHLRGAIYGSKIKKFLANHQITIPVIWDSVDSISHLFKQSARQSRQLSKRWLTQFELSRTEEYEYRLANRFERVLVTSMVDRDSFIALKNGKEAISRDCIAVLPNGVDLDYFHPLDCAREPATLVVSGKMSYHANISMTLHLAKEIMPLLWKKQPEVRLWIVGKDPDKEIVRLAENPLINVTGTVPDIRHYLQKATIAVAPIVYGAGIQNKVLEAMACATPVVTSPQALTALEAVAGKDLEQASTPDEYAEKILLLLSSSERQHQIGQSGRSYVEAHHQWRNITKKLVTLYQSGKRYNNR